MVQQFCIEMGNISNCQAHYDEIGPYCSHWEIMYPFLVQLFV